MGVSWRRVRWIGNGTSAPATTETARCVLFGGEGVTKRERAEFAIIASFIIVCLVMGTAVAVVAR